MGIESNTDIGVIRLNKALGRTGHVPTPNEARDALGDPKEINRRFQNRRGYFPQEEDYWVEQKLDKKGGIVPYSEFKRRLDEKLAGD